MTSQDTCYVCLGTENDRDEFVDSCDCKGSIKLHESCFDEIRKSKSICDICKPTFKYTGFVVQYLDKGIIAIGFLIRGKKEGLWTYSYRIGQKYKEGSYVKGLMEGHWTFYYDPCNLAYGKRIIPIISYKEREGIMKEGKPEGYWKYYNTDGSLNRRLKMIL